MTSSTRGFDIPSLDGVRALAVLLVFLAHAGLAVPGNFGVTVFFFLSGYLITTLLRLELERTGRLGLRDFYLRRAFRILPPMYAVLAAAVVLTLIGFIPGTVSAAAVAMQSVHLTNYLVIDSGWWDGIVPGTWIYWSLAVEEHFYLLFPLVYLGIRRIVPSARGQAGTILGLCAAVLAWRLFLVLGLDVSRDRTYIASDTRIDSILFGCALAVYGNPALDPTSIAARRWKWVLVPLSAAVLAITFVVRGPWFEETLRYSLQGIALIPLFVVAVRYPTWAPMRLLNIRWVRFCGVLSYAIYLVHPTVIWTVQQRTTLHPIAQGVIALGTTLLLALGIHSIIERPFARLRRRLATVRRAAAEGSPPVVRPERAADGVLALLVSTSGEPATAPVPRQLT
jgi:peptidoglycan/LPS O-acetylase OafA/YrhL